MKSHKFKDISEESSLDLKENKPFKKTVLKRDFKNILTENQEMKSYIGEIQTSFDELLKENEKLKRQ